MKKSFKNPSVIIFIIISLFYAVGNFVWWKINTPVIPQVICALHFLDIFQNGWLYSNAPLITWIMKGIFFVFGKEYFDLQIIILNYFLFLMALYFIYKIGLELKDKETGNVAMILFALTPAVYGLSRQYGHQDWHVMIAMVVNIYCLIKLDFFEDRKWSILYGITVGLGLLVKDEFLPYFFTPWLYVVIVSLLQGIRKKKIINMLVTIAIGSLIAGCHYFRIEIINKILHEPIVETVPVFTFANLRVMTIGLWEELLSPPIFLLFIFGFIFFLIRYKDINKYIFFLWFIVPWSIIMFMPHHKEVEYGIVFVPVMILFPSMLVSNIKNIIFKKIILIFCILICLLQFLDFSFGLDIKLFSNKIKYQNNDIFYYDKFCRQQEVSLMMYKKEKYVISFVNYYINNFNNRTCFIYHLIQDPEFNNFNIQIYLNIKNIKSFRSLDDIDKSDIIVFTEKYDIREIEFLFNLEKECNERHCFLFDDKELFEEVSLAVDKLKNEYILLDEIYLDGNNKKPENHIYILGKKDLFVGKENIIKYPYNENNIKYTYI